MHFKTHNSDFALLLIVGCLLAAVAYFFGLPLLVMLAWNYVVPQVFGGPQIDYVTAFLGMFLLSVIGSAFRATVSFTTSRR